METLHPKHWEVREKLCPALRDNFWLLGSVKNLTFIFVPAAREPTFEAQRQRLVYSACISCLA